MPAANKDNTNLVTTNVNLSTNLLIDALIGGTKWGGDTGTGAKVYYSFPTSNNPLYWSDVYYNISDSFSETYTGFSAFNVAQQAAASSALQSWANVANINIVRVAETVGTVGDIRFAFTSNTTVMAASNYAYAYEPNNTAFGGDIWLNPAPPALGSVYTLGASGYETLIHEVGHALGLRHSFANPDVPGDISLPVDKEYFKYSVMSYSDTATTFDNGFSGYYPTGPMLLDIQAIQYLYGANMSYHTGNDTYVFNGTTKYYQTIWDAGGIDTILYNSTTSAIIRLTAGEFSRMGAPFAVGGATNQVSVENVGIAYNVVIENAIGGSASDEIYGNQYNNVIDGRQGTDYLYGGAGDDTYTVDLIVTDDIYTEDAVFEYANEGNDTVNLRGVFVNNYTADIVLLQYYGDQVENLNAAATSATKLNLTGNALDNILTGNLANNMIDGGAGADTLIGGTGNDIYVVDNVGDIVTELLNSGIDTVLSSVSFSLLDTDGAGLNGGNVENLTLTGADNINGTGNAFNNILLGNAGANTLIGNAGADTLDGGLGADSLNGGDGNDTYIVDDVNDTVTEDNALAAGGIDLVKSSASTFTLGVNIENLSLTSVTTDINNLVANNINGIGNALANTINGNSGNNVLEGKDGIDILTGGLGNDTYIVNLTATGLLQDIVTEGVSINDTADTIQLRGNSTNAITSTLILGANIEILDASATGTSKLNLTGNILNNALTGNDAANYLLDGIGSDMLNGGAGNDTLDGGVGIDNLSGGAGDDTYLIDLVTTAAVIGTGVNLGNNTPAFVSLQDNVTENANDGTDTLILRGSATLINATTLTLADNIENMDVSLTGATKLNLTGNILDNKLTGNAAANVIDGGDGNDTLDGGAGLDTLIGGNGDDTYIVDSLAEVNLINDLSGNNTLNIGLTYTLANAGSFTNLILTGAAAINGTGNSLNNILIGNAAANNLVGLDGDDAINGGAGADTLNGGLGLDGMTGGDGNDVYFVDNIGDQVIETSTNAAIGGIDLVQSSISFDLSTSGANVENLTLLTVSTDINNLAANNINATGNVLANTITGNAGDNLVDGGAGIDVLTGGLGNDTYIVDLTAAGALQDSVTESLNAGSDTIQLRGNSTNTLAALLTLGANLENLNVSATGSSKLNLTGNALTNSLIGNAADNILDGGLGADALTGGAGNDTYVIDNFGDSVTEQFNEGIDLIKIGMATAGGLYTLGDNIENGALTNAVAFNLTGNALDNVITGNGAANTLIGLDGNDSLDGGAGNDSLIGGLGNDTLIGGLGADTLDGGDGNDVYVVDSTLDVVSVDSSGIDLVKSSITNSIAARADLDNITLTGLAAINATGNDLANMLVGNDASNILNGGAGADAMNGGKGADTYLVDDAGDTVTEDFTLAQAGGVDLVNSSVSFTLGNNLDNLTLLTASTDPLSSALNNIDGTGNDLVNIIIGNGGNNILTGYAGNDTLMGNAGDDKLDGGLGVDTMTGGTGNDVYIVDNINDVVIETALPTEDHLILFDTILSSVSYTLSNNVEYLVLTGSDNINGTANAAGGSYITGNNANNIFKGGAGGSTFIGMGGDDTYITTLGTAVYSNGVNPNKTIAYIKDNIGESANGGIDTLILNGSIAIAERTLISLNFYGYPTNTPPGYLIYNNYNTQNIENLDISLTGLSKVDLEGNLDNNKLTGNAFANIINGGDGNDTLDGGAGLDTLIGGLGDDTYIVDSLAEANLINDLSGNNTLNIGLTYTLANGGSFTNLNLTGAAAINGTGNNADNILIGNDAANTLDGGFGNDTMDGGKGNDTYIVNSINDAVKEQLTFTQGGGIDLVKSSVDFDLSNNLDRANIENLTLISTEMEAIYATGNTLANIITGSAASNVLDGREGSDTLIGGLGNDSYYVDLTASGLLQDTVIEAASLYDVFDTILLRGSSTNTIASTLTLGANIEILDASATGSSKLNLTGNTASNSLTGNSADNILDGGLGADALIGGAGNDTYLVDNFGDSVTENANEGIDLVKINLAVAGALYTLGDNIENGMLTNAVVFNVTGNYLNNILTGNAADNVIDGGLGADTLIGGLGNDTYIVDDTGDIITELLNSGIDTVQSSISYSLIDTDGAGLNGGNLENLTLTGLDNINAAGNAFNNIIIGNLGNNTLDGLAGNDSLNGGDGNDTLYGGAGLDTLDGGARADSMSGGDGADVYIVDDINDIVTEDNALAAGGIDLVKSSASSFTLSANIENITLLTGGYSATGNALANIIIGNSGNNIIDGGAGIDNLTGGLGNDTYIIDLTATGLLQDTVTEGVSINDTADTIQLRGNSSNAIASTLTLGANIEILDASLTGNSKLNLTGNILNNTLIGNDANNLLSGLAGLDTLNGGAGNDTLSGGTGNDTFMFDSVGISNYDFITDFVSGQDKINLIGSVFSTALGSGFYSDMFNTTYIFALDTNDFIYYDRANGGLYFDADANGIGAAQLIAKFTLGTILLQTDFVNAITDLPLTGTVLADTLIGGAGHDTLSGLAGNDSLIGGAGNDVLDGGEGDDSLYGGDGNDTLVGGTGTDYVDGGAGDDYIIGGEDTIFGGAGNDTISTNGGNEYIDGGDGNDTLSGGYGADTIIGGNGSDNIYGIGQLYGGDGDDIINVVSSIGSATIWGGAGNDFINATFAGLEFYNPDIVYGGDGNDQIYATAGNDTLTGGSGLDTFIFTKYLPDLYGHTNTDTITDFVSASDNINLYSGYFTSLSPGVLNNNNFVSNTNPTAIDADDYILYNTSTGSLYYDSDGNGLNAAVEFAVLLGLPILLASDISIY